MQQTSLDSQIEERIAQLEAISARRNELLSEMYHMMRRRRSVGTVLDLREEDDDEDDDLHIFLQKFDLHKNPETGSISQLNCSDLNIKDVYPSSPSSSEDYHVSEDSFTTAPTEGRISSRLSGPVIAQQTEDLDDDRDELDLLDSPNFSEEVATVPQSSNLSALSTIDANSKRDSLDPTASPEKQAGLNTEIAVLPENLPEDGREGYLKQCKNIANEEDGDEENRIREEEEGGIDDEQELNVEERKVVNATLVQDEIRINEIELSKDLHNRKEEEEEEEEEQEEEEEEEEEEGTPDNFMPDGQADAMDVDIGPGTPSEQEPPLEEAIDTKVAQDIEMEATHELKELPTTASETFANEEVMQATDGSKDGIQTERPPSPLRTKPTLEDLERRIRASFLHHVLTDQNTPAIEIPSRHPVVILAPLPSHTQDTTVYHFEFPAISRPESLSVSIQARHGQYNASLTLPDIKLLPADFNRKVKSSKQRKREKERNEGRKDRDMKDDCLPMSINRWFAALNANPVWKRVSRAPKCLNTREWGVALTELKIIRAISRIENLKSEGRWSFRQPKKQRGLGGLLKTHWDHLLDEMKWMRIDYREERKWKVTLAFTLSTSVLEWHALKSWEERIAEGICVKWKSLKPVIDCSEDFMDVDQTEPGVNWERPKSLLPVDYASDEEEDDEQDRKSILDVLEPKAVIEESLVSSESLQNSENNNPLEPKKEDIDLLPLTIHHDEQETRQDRPMTGTDDNDVLTALKSSSNDPILGSKSTSQSTDGDLDQGNAPSKSSPNFYAPIRDRIIYSDSVKLFVDSNDMNGFAVSTSEDKDLAPADLIDLFPDLRQMTLLDISPVFMAASTSDGKKRSEKRPDKDDPSKRVEETAYTKVYPADKFMFQKPTLIGSLNPARHWKNDKWTSMDESPVFPETENPIRIPEEFGNELFENRVNNPPPPNFFMQMQGPAYANHKDRKRGADHLWSASDDLILKSCTEKYPNNWALIAECFNSSRLTTPTDKRTDRDCFDRWREKWGSEGRQKPFESNPSAADDSSTPQNPSQMTTRGVKRLASSSVSNSAAFNAASGSEPKKRRRHLLLQESIRKASKKRVELAQKPPNSRKSNIHESHHENSKMLKLSPAEISRMKAEMEARENQNHAVNRRRQEEVRNSRDASQRSGSGVTVEAAGQQQPQPVNPVQRPAGTSLTVPQIRSQVNIARISTPINTGNARLSPQQLIQMQQRAVAVAQQQTQAQAHAQGQVQVQVQPQSQGQGQTMNVVSAANVKVASNNGTHISPVFANRDASSSPAHLSPPHTSVAAGGNVHNSPRMTAGQMPNQPNVLQQAAQLAGSVPRPPSNLSGPFYIPNTMPNGFTPEQLQNALRMQMMQQAQQAVGQQQTKNFPS